MKRNHISRMTAMRRTRSGCRPAGERSGRGRTARLGFESLEPRMLLDGSAIINEFMAINDSTLETRTRLTAGDPFVGEYLTPDWLEIYNPGDSALDLADWQLQDSGAVWTFPSGTSIDAYGYLVVFASDLNITDPALDELGYLHTNFKLSGSGEELILRDDLGIVVDEYTGYPTQTADISYGIAQDVETTPFVAGGDSANYVVPTGEVTDWTTVGFNDSGWDAGPTAIGYVDMVPGFAVWNYKATIGVGNLDNALDVLSNPGLQSGSWSENRDVLNYLNSGGNGHYPGDVDFPGFTGDEDNFVVEANGTVTIPSAGSWSFGVNSDDGFRLTIPGTTTTDTYNSSTPTGSDTISYYNGRGPGDTFGVFTFPAADTYDLSLVFFEGGVGSELELFAAPGSYTWFDSGAFDLVGDTANGGLEANSQPVGGGETSTTLASLIETDVEGIMKDVNASMFVRIPFTVADPTLYTSLTLKMKYDDGYVAYLNGQEIARANFVGTPAWNSQATADRTDAQATEWEDVDVSTHVGELLTGPNVLAIHAMNYTADNGDFLVLPELAEILYLGLGEHFFATASPGEANIEEFWLHVEDTSFSHDRGFYDEPFDLGITTDTTNADIYYTLDGSEPSDTNGTLYTGPIYISTTTVVRAKAYQVYYAPTNVDTQTYLFLDDVVQQPSDPAGFPASWGGTTADYEMDASVVTDPLYEDQMRDALLSIPTMSIVTDSDNLFGPSGIYSNPYGEGLTYERPTSVEWINTDGTTGFQVDAGLRIYGGAFRGMNLTRKKTFRLLFKSDYGPSKLDFPMFGEGAATEFDTIILRGGANDAWNNWGGTNTQYIVDEFMRRTQLAMDQPSGHGTYVHLYVNGLYWGLYNPVERPEASFSATYFGGEKENWDALNSGAPTGDSNTTTWNAMLSQVRAGLADMASYQMIQGNNPDGTNNPAYDDLLDVDNYIDYMLSNFYGGTGDWPWHNWYVACQRPPEATGFKSFNWDSEGAIVVWSNLNANVTGVADGLGEPYAALKLNSEFMMLFADHVHKHLFNGGAATTDVSHDRYQELADEIELAVIAESARWGDQATGTAYTQAQWAATRDYVLNTYMPQRTAIVLGQLVTAGLYPNVVAPSFDVNATYQHGGTIDLGDLLTMDAPDGTIYYTLDGTDPRPFGGGVPDPGQAYGGAIALFQTTLVKSRVYYSGQWSALNEAAYYVDLSPDIRITEIMYHPAEPTAAEQLAGFLNREQFEFIEIQNLSTTETLPLEGLRFTDGIDFVFPDVSIGPGDYMVVVQDQAAFEERYGIGTAVIAGEHLGWLNNAGETVQLDAPVGGVIHQFSYSDNWYDHTDGEGFSLTVRDPEQAKELWNEQEGWRASAAPGGTPGSDDTLQTPGSIVITEVLAHSNLSFEDMIELHNTSGSPIDVSGWFLSDQKTNDLGIEVLTKYEIPTLPPIDGGQYIVLYEDTQFGTAFSLSELGDDVYLSSNAGGVAGGYREHVDFGASPTNVSIGLHTKSTGGTDFTLLSAHTFGAANAAPYMEDLVFNEVMYHPPDATADEILAGFPNDDDFEFVEIYNRSATTSYTLSNYYVGNGIGTTFGWYNADGDGVESWTLEPGATATWQATLPAGLDEYAVYARWDLLDGEGNARDLDGQARYRIDHATGSPTVIRDQKPDDDEPPGYMDPNGWVLLGTHDFDGSGQVVLTRGTNDPDNWTIADQVKFVSASHTEVVDDPVLDSWYTANGPAQIGAGEYVVIVRDYDAFVERYGTGISVAAEYTGNLSNDGEKVKLFRAGIAEPVTRFIPYYRIDYVNYNDAPPWPLEPDGAGPALNRLNTSAYGNDAGNWEPSAVPGTPGELNISMDSTPPSVPGNVNTLITLAPDTISLTWSASQDAESSVSHYIIYRNGDKLSTSTTESYDDTDVVPAVTYTYQVSAVNRDGFKSGLSLPAITSIPGIVSYHTPDDSHIEIVFSERLEQTSAETLGNYVFVGGSLADVELRAPGRIVVLTTAAPMVLGNPYSVTVNDVATLSGSPMPNGQQVAFDYVPKGSGYILREYWTGIGGNEITYLTSDPRYPDSPTGFSYPSSLEAPTGWADNYGTRMLGYVHPPMSGNYTFWIASDDHSELWLSTDDNPANKVLIASMTGATGWRQWDANPSQQSLPIALVAGQKYYIEALQKEGGGGDHVSVRWQLPDASWENDNSSLPIPGVRLSPFGPLPDFSPPSTPLKLSGEVAGGTQVELSWEASVDLEGGVDHYVIYRDGAVYDTTATTDFTDYDVSPQQRHLYRVTAVNPDGYESTPSEVISVVPAGIAAVDPTDATTMNVMFTEPVEEASAEQTGNYSLAGVSFVSAELQSDNFTVVLTTAGTIAGGTLTVDGVNTLAGDPMPPNMQAQLYSRGTILWEYWLGIGGTAVSDLTSNPNYPDNPSGEQFVTLFEADVDWANQYGGRIAGYLYPDTTGYHTFWMASDDNGQLWLSTDDNPANTQIIASVPSWAGSRQWYTHASQESDPIYLQAGHRYYIEALMKEDGGGDNLAVGWETPSTPFDNTPIPGTYLSPAVQQAQGSLATSVTVFPLTTTDRTPSLSGNVDDPGVDVTVRVDGRYYAATNVGNGMWMLADDVIEPDLADGTYDVTICVTDSSGLTAFDASTAELTIGAQAAVDGQYVFYNNSAWDGLDPLPNAEDDDAIATDKLALMPGGHATFGNYTSYANGINGIMVDIDNLPAASGAIDPYDYFVFRVGNSDDPGTWQFAPAPLAGAVRDHAGTDRLTVVWEDFQIRNQWLEVTVLDNELTGLTEQYVCYFGNAVAEAGNSGADAQVTTTDLLLARNNPRNFTYPAGIEFNYDYNRDKRVNATDVLLARNNQTNFLNRLRLIDLSVAAAAASPPAASPELPEQESVLRQLAWLHELERMEQQQRSASEQDPREEAVDALLAYGLL